MSIVAFSIPIFPEGSLSESVITTVWVGVFVLAMFNLRLGWTLSGLVVPGYLVPLLIVKPCAALVVFGQGVLTYWIVYAFSRYGSRLGFWSNVFGRDRFFGLILASIAVRVVMDGYLLPRFSRYAMVNWGVQFDLLNNLHSFGLIIVSLIANQFWKPGLVRGLTPLFVTVGITYLIVRYVLMMYTNFSIGAFHYIYEDIAISVLASPKAYIILVITAFVASRLNLYYAWDFNGILIPSLMAIQWYAPLKVLTSVLEAAVVYCVARYILQLRWFREATVEGARKILLFFNVSFAYKLALGHVLGTFFPALHVTDFFGFGYLLPSLLAIKMHDKKIPIRITRTTLQASLMGACAAGVAGFLFTFLPQTWLVSEADAVAVRAIGEERTDKTLIEKLREEKVYIYNRRVSEKNISPMQSELDAFVGALRRIKNSFAEGEEDDLETARLMLAQVGYSAVLVEGRYLYLSEAPPRRGWGAYVIDKMSEGDLVVEVPAPLEEWGTMECGACFFQLFKGKGLAIYTKGSRVDGRSGHQALVTRRTFFDLFHTVFARREALQVRGYGAEVLRTLYKVKVTRDSLKEPNVASSLWVTSQVPQSVRLSQLKELVEKIKLEWRNSPFRNVQREASNSGFAELFLRRDDRKRILARWISGADRMNGAPDVEDTKELPRGVSLGQWLLQSKEYIAPRGSNLYVEPPLENLLFLDEEVLKPLVHVMLRRKRTEVDWDGAVGEVRAIHSAAKSLGYEVIYHKESGSGHEYIILSEDRNASAKRYWGTYVFRVGNFKPYIIEIPHPVYEENTLEYGVSMFQRLQASSLLIAGSHPKCNTDGTADVALLDNKKSLFNLANQVLLRDTGDAAFLAIQVRALGYRPGIGLPDADALVAFSDASVSEDTLGPMGIEFLSRLKRDGLSIQFVDGSRGTVGYEVYGSAQALYLSHTKNKEFSALWLSPFERRAYRQYSEDLLQEAQFAALGVEMSNLDLLTTLAREESIASLDEIPDGIVALLRRYRATQDINSVYSIRILWRNLRLVRTFESGTQRPYMLIYQNSRLLPVVANLGFTGDRCEESSDFESGFPVSAAGLQRYVEADGCLLLIGNAAK